MPDELMPNSSGDHNLERLVREVERFPTLPDVATRALEELERAECDFEEVASLVSLDPVLAGRVLRMANSAYFGAVHKAESVEAGLARMGIRECRALILTVALMDAMPELPAPHNAKVFWTLSLASALVSQQIAVDLEYEPPERAYLAGLVHLLGEAVLAIQFTDRFRRAIEVARRDALPLSVSLTEEFGCDHAGLSAHILTRWSFPQEVIDAVRFQFTPSQSRSSDLLCSLVVAGDGQCRDFGLGLDDPTYVARSWARKLTPGFFEALGSSRAQAIEDYLDGLTPSTQEAIDFATTIF